MSVGVSNRFLLAIALLCVASTAPTAISFAPAAHDFMTVSQGLAGSFLIALFGGGLLSFQTERSLRWIEESTARMAAGEVDTPGTSMQDCREGGVVKKLYELSSDLRERVQALSRLSREQDAILRSMTEGVLTIDSEGRVTRVNEAARSLLGISKAYVEGVPVGELIRNDDIIKFVHEASSSMIPKTGTTVLKKSPEVIVDLYGSPLFQDDGSSSGTLIVFRDMTRVHKLETIRRDFVANVSHELRTPITSIKGFAETLLEGAMHEPEALRNFLGIIGKHAERLHAIFNDLLMLARLEAGSDKDELNATPQQLALLIKEAIETCAAKAASKNIVVHSAVPEDIRVEANSSLIEQALVNLIDNAIKYSDTGASVSVAAERHGDLVRCMVSDTGPGIDSRHLPRLFERFYRVDQGRSRQMGGTGLGLSIVKHIAQVHGGRVDVQSTLGQGSTFSIYLKTR